MKPVPRNRTKSRAVGLVVAGAAIALAVQAVLLRSSESSGSPAAQGKAAESKQITQADADLLAKLHQHTLEEQQVAEDYITLQQEEALPPSNRLISPATDPEWKAAGSENDDYDYLRRVWRAPEICSATEIARSRQLNPLGIYVPREARERLQKFLDHQGDTMNQLILSVRRVYNQEARQRLDAGQLIPARSVVTDEEWVKAKGLVAADWPGDPSGEQFEKSVAWQAAWLARARLGYRSIHSKGGELYFADVGDAPNAREA